MGRFCLIATKAQSEILGLVPSNPRRNTSKRILDVLRIGNIVEMRFRLISSSFPLYFLSCPLSPC
jgi:hypothetical protein